MSQHVENLMDKWFPLLKGQQELPGVVATTVSQGGTRPVWNVETEDTETLLMAWPERSLMRSSVVVHGEKGGKLDPYVVAPLMEGFPNAMIVEGSYAWGKEGLLGEVQAIPKGEEGKDPLWFYDPLFFRDKRTDLTPGTEQVFYLSGMCYGIRQALLDEMTVTKGPGYEAHAAKWLKENPGKTRLDVPLLKVPLNGVHAIAPTPRCSEYQARCRIYDVDSFEFGPEGSEVKIYRFGTSIGDGQSAIHIILYAPEKICLKGYVPKENHEVDVVFWMQGRIVDPGDTAPEQVPLATGDTPAQ